ncbi:MAG: pyruvate dehydrogenase (acetyl-transferring) E1 component subunit alpha [Longimicrobiales bacterium]
MAEPKTAGKARSKRAPGDDEKQREADTRAPSANGRTSVSGPSPEAQADGVDTQLAGLGKEELHWILHQMLLGRRFEEKAAEAYALGKIGGFCHLYIGQEAVGIGAIAAIRDDDYVVTAYREHVQALAKGMPARDVMAELYGRSAGSSKGKGGSMHLYSAERNFLGGWGIVGGQIPLATGVGWAIKYRGEDRVCLCFMGEAAVNQGAFHESLNMAALWKLPVIFIVENNRFGMGTAFERVSALYDIAQKGQAYDMPGMVADGMNVLAMRHTVQQAVERARTESTPTLIEARCYRFMGHSMSDPVHGVYRTKEEVEEEKAKDPIKVFIDDLQRNDLLTDDELRAIDERVRAEVDDAADFAEQAPDPEPEELYRDVYAQMPERGRMFFDARDDAPHADTSG